MIAATTCTVLVSPSGDLVAVRRRESAKPWHVTDKDASVYYFTDEQVKGWTPLVAKPAANDDPDVWESYTHLIHNIGAAHDPAEVRDHLDGAPARVDINGPLALIQCSVGSQVDLLRRLAQAGLLLDPPA